MANDFDDVIESFEALKVTDQQKVAAASVDKLPDDKKTTTLVEAAKSLPEAAKKEVLDAIRLGLPPPTPDTNNWIWKTIVGAFVFVFVATTASMIYGLLNNNQVAFDKFLIIFTSVVGYLAGLISPSPIKSNNG
ncbi:MAG: hypothetical protein ACKVQJ_00445 [Pyrinomonadaceae bacterium]